MPFPFFYAKLPKTTKISKNFQKSLLNKVDYKGLNKYNVIGSFKNNYNPECDGGLDYEKE